jgi:hypothetical protein
VAASRPASPLTISRAVSDPYFGAPPVAVGLEHRARPLPAWLGRKAPKISLITLNKQGVNPATREPLT